MGPGWAVVVVDGAVVVDVAGRAVVGVIAVVVVRSVPAVVLGADVVADVLATAEVLELGAVSATSAVPEQADATSSNTVTIR